MTQADSTNLTLNNVALKEAAPRLLSNRTDSISLTNDSTTSGMG